MPFRFIFARARATPPPVACSISLLRISSPSKDELEAAFHLLKAEDFGCELQFGIYRE